jgi:hypothetical protein
VLLAHEAAFRRGYLSARRSSVSPSGLRTRARSSAQCGDPGAGYAVSDGDVGSGSRPSARRSGDTGAVVARSRSAVCGPRSSTTGEHRSARAGGRRADLAALGHEPERLPDLRLVLRTLERQPTDRVPVGPMMLDLGAA